MSDPSNETRRTAIAAAIVLLVVGAAIYFLPKVVLSIGAWSPAAGFAVGLVVVMAFFLIFWLRTWLRK